MKLTIQHHQVRSTHAVDSLVEQQIFGLEPKLQIDEAHVRLERCREVSPRYRVRVHLVTPGPDVVAEARDHTLTAAIRKLMAAVAEKVNWRSQRRVRRSQSNRQSPAIIRMGRGRRG